MIDTLTLAAFVPAALALNLTPGADMMFCLGQGLRGGRAPAIAAAAGISTGSLVHVLLAGLGLGAAMQALPWLFDAVRWAGVAYLLFLAWQALRDSAAPRPDRPARPMPAARAFWQGLAVNLGNPKVILFVLAFIPQFVDAAAPVLPQFLAFGAILAIGGALVNGTVGAMAGGLGRAILSGERFNRWLGRVSAGIFGLLALRLAVMERA